MANDTANSLDLNQLDPVHVRNVFQSLLTYILTKYHNGSLIIDKKDFPLLDLPSTYVEELLKNGDCQICARYDRTKPH